MLKTVSSITNALGALNYKGTWDASTNSPTLASGVGKKGDFYVVSVAGSTNLDGLTTWYVGDWATFNGSAWQRVEGGVDDPAPSLKSNSTTGLMQITGPAAGQTRVMTIPDANFTAARRDAAQTFTGTQTFSSDIVVNNFTVGRGAGNINGNVAYGPSALAANTTGYDNYASGFFALAANQNGIRNTAAGSYALQANTSGSYNTAFGRLALYAVTSGSNNFAVGYNSGNDAVRTISTNSNEGVLGNNDTTAIYAKVALTVTSDVRDKTEIKPVELGLSFVNSVQPISYRFTKSRQDNTPTGRTTLGFSAQEVLALQGNTQIVDNSDPEHLKINNQDLIAVLFNAVKQLSQEIETLKSQISK